MHSQDGKVVLAHELWDVHPFINLAGSSAFDIQGGDFEARFGALLIQCMVPRCGGTLSPTPGCRVVVVSVLTVGPSI